MLIETVPAEEVGDLLPNIPEMFSGPQMDRVREIVPGLQKYLLEVMSPSVGDHPRIPFVLLVAAGGVCCNPDHAHQGSEGEGMAIVQLTNIQSNEKLRYLLLSAAERAKEVQEEAESNSFLEELGELLDTTLRLASEKKNMRRQQGTVSTSSTGESKGEQGAGGS